MSRLSETTAKGILEIKLAGLTSQRQAAISRRTDAQRDFNNENKTIGELDTIISDIGHALNLIQENEEAIAF